MTRVYERPGPMPRTRFFYFYYLTHRPEDTQAYYTRRDNPVRHDEVPGEIVQILEERRRGELVLRGDDLGDLNWHHKSYIVVVWDPRHGGKLEEGNAMTFDFRASQPGEQDGGDHSFRWGRDFEGLPQPYDRHGVFYCYNKMTRKSDGNELGEMESERFWVEVHHDRPRAHDDTATNVGPPRT